jgi:beta-glucanase (GH16 family)
VKLFVIAVIFTLIAAIMISCAGFVVGSNKIIIESPQVFAIKAPVSGNYPQGLFKYPYRAKSLDIELFTQTLEWEPKVSKIFDVNTQYTAILTLDPVSVRHSFNGVSKADIIGLPVNGVEEIITENKGTSLVIKIKFERTANKNAASHIVFSDEFEGIGLDLTKWDLCPEWDRQGRSSWRDDMVSVGGGLLHLKFRRDPELGRAKSNNKTLAGDWIRAGGVRTRKKNDNILYDNGFGYYEARIKFPVVSGSWGAFWLMSPTEHILTNEGVVGTEIDIVETIHNDKNIYNSALHWNGYGSKHKAVGSEKIAEDINIYDGNFHIFALDWSPSEYIFYVDGKEFWRADGGAKFKKSGINQNLNYIKLTVESAVWAGTIPADFTEDEMLVDYVRVYNQPRISN